VNAPSSGYLADFESARDSLPGMQAAWLRQLRNGAMDIFLQQGYPTTRLEDWKYTDLRAVAKGHFTVSAGRRRIAAAALGDWSLDADPAHRLVFIDGRYAAELSSAGIPSNGISITSLGEALASHPDRLEPYLGSTLDLDEPGFNAMNTAFMRDGACIRLEQGTVLEQPVHLVFVSSGIPDALSAVRNVVVAEPDSKATIIESWVSLGDVTCLTTAVTEIILADNAAVEHYRLGLEGESGYHMAGIYVRQGNDSRFASHNCALGGRLVRNDLQVALDGTGAECVLNGLYVTHGRQHIDNHTRIDHNRPQASSREWYKGVLDDRSRAVFNGRVVVHRDAQQTAAEQSNHNLLLSGKAEVDAKPQLEIYADNVKCAHGCTVGQLDESALFYLRTRGVGEAVARQLLVYAFAVDVLERMRISSVRRLLERQLTGRLMHTGLQGGTDRVLNG
jgi:Fe-S cluster assembly protein SufD